MPLFILALGLVSNCAYAVSIQSEHFAQHQGQPVTLFTLKNKHGMQVKITNYGATMTSLMVPDKHGKTAEITAGFNQFSSYLSEEYQSNNPYFGGIVGRYASVLKNGQFELDGKTHQLSQNMPPHHLHGGQLGFDKRIWQVKKAYQEPDAAVLILAIISKDGEEGYPGELKLDVEYRLTNQNQIKIRYLASTNKKTPLSLTHHAYFNLNGFTENVLNHHVQINSDSYLTPDNTHIPDGKLTKVQGTAADFNQSKLLANAFKTLKMGFEHYYVFDNPNATLNQVATIRDLQSGRQLVVSTTEPGALLYTGRYTSDKLAREDGLQYGQFKAFCFETSKYPNGPNIKGSPRTYLEPGHVYDETTVFEFSW